MREFLPCHKVYSSTTIYAQSAVVWEQIDLQSNKKMNLSICTSNTFRTRGSMSFQHCGSLLSLQISSAVQHKYVRVVVVFERRTSKGSSLCKCTQVPPVLLRCEGDSTSVSALLLMHGFTIRPLQIVILIILISILRRRRRRKRRRTATRKRS